MITMISYLDLDNTQANNGFVFVPFVGSSNSSCILTEVYDMPINIFYQEIFNHSNSRFYFDLCSRLWCSNLTLANGSWYLCVFLYPNRESWFFNISCRNNRVNIVEDSFLSSYWWFFNYFSNRWVIFEPLLLWEINVSSKGFTQRSYYLRVKAIFSANLMKSIGKHKRFDTIILKFYT